MIPTQLSQATVLSLETAVPDVGMTAAEYADIAARLCAKVPREAALIHSVARRSGIDRRYSCLAQKPPGGPLSLPFHEQSAVPPGTEARMLEYERLAPKLAVGAAEAAMRSAGISSNRVTHLVSASCTGFFAPGIELALIRDLGLPTFMERLHIGFMGCHAAINALRAAQAICARDEGAVVLVLCVELCTLHFQRGLGRDEVVPNSLFGDGAAAMLLGSRTYCDNEFDTSGQVGGSDAVPCHLRLVDTASLVIPGTEELMSWRIGDTGFRMTLDSAVPDAITKHLGEAMKAFLSRHDLAIENIDGWAIHPGGPRILESALKALRLPDDAGESSREVLKNHGNMSSPTVLFILKELMDRGVRGSIAAVAFGPGLTAEMALFEAGTKA